jgi:O-antigen/teichoic acid export membrane protein
MSVRKNSIIYFLTNWVVYFFQFLTTIVVSRLLPPSEIGLFTVAMAATTILQGLREFGTVNYLIKEPSIDREQVRVVFTLSIFVGWSIGILLFFAKDSLADFFGNQRLADVITIICGTFLVYPVGLPATGMLRRERRFSHLGIVMTIASVAGFLATTFLCVSGYGALSLAYGTLVNSIALSVAALLFYPNHLTLLPSFRSWRRVATFGLQASLASLVSKANQTLPDLFIGKLLGFHDAAVFSRGRVLTLLVDRFSFSPLYSAAMPELARRNREALEICNLLYDVLQTTCIISWSLLAFVFCHATQIIRTVYGDQWIGAVPILQALCLYQAVLTIATPARALLEAKGEIGASLLNELFFLFVLLPVVLLCSSMGLTSLSWLLCGPAALAVLLYWFQASRHLEGFWTKNAPSLILPLVVSLAIILSQLVIDYFAAPHLYHLAIHWQLLFLALEFAVACLVALIVLKWSGHKIYDFVSRSLRRLLQKGGLP